MNTKNSKKDNNQGKKAIEPIQVLSYGVDHVRCIETKNGDMVVFTLCINGVTISNCRVATTKNGKDFVSYPQYKGKDDKYYSYIFAPLPEEVEQVIMLEIQRRLDEQ